MPKFPWGLGGAPDAYDYRDAEYTRAAEAGLAADATGQRPLRVDNRELYPIIYNQEREGACVGCVSALALSSGFGLQISNRFTQQGAMLRDEIPGDNTNCSTLRGAWKSARRDGGCAYPLWPFKPFDTSGKQPGADDDAALHRVLRYERVRTLTQILDGIWVYGGVAITIMCHTGWKKPNPQTGRIKYDRRYSDLSWHAAWLEGFDEPDEWFWLHNSWGEWYPAVDPAMKGRAKIGFNDVMYHLSDAWAVLEFGSEIPDD